MGLKELAEAWNSARDDAGFGVQEAMLLPLAGRAEGSELAKWFYPGEELVWEPDFPLDPGQLEQANTPEWRGGHRIAAWAGIGEVPLAAKLRHELEHGRQWAVCGERFVVGFDLRVRWALGEAFGPRLGSGRLYNLFPTEASANAAATDHVRRVYGDDEVERWREDLQYAVLFRGQAVVALESLPLQTICFASLASREFEQLVGADGLDECLAIAGQDDRRLWRVLCNDDGVQERAREARARVPSDEEIEAAGDRPGDAWDATADGLRAGYARALEIANAAP